MRLMLADDSLSPILNMTCYIVKACHLLGYLTDGSLSPEFLMRTFDKMTNGFDKADAVPALFAIIFLKRC